MRQRYLLVATRDFLSPLSLSLSLVLAPSLVACGKGSSEKNANATSRSKDGDKGKNNEASDKSKTEAAETFIKKVDKELKERWTTAEQAAWTNQTDITDEHEKAEAAAQERLMAYMSEAIKEGQKFKGLKLEADTKRQLKRLRLATAAPAPNDAAKRKELAEIAAKMPGLYGKGEYCTGEGKKKECRDLGQLSQVLAESQNYDELLEAWKGWRTISPPIRDTYKRFVELSNEGAKEIGFGDLGELWRSKFDLSPEAFSAEMERLWKQVKPLYDELHCHVRAKLSEKYGKDKVPSDKAIPAHLLGNMWAQEWGNIYPLLEPHKGQPSIDVTQALKDKGYDATKMVKTAEDFFVSVGLDPLPQTFWERSMFLQPEGKKVVCHASAWDLTMNDDLRIKMCIKTNMEDLITIHHELGHNYYYHYYHKLPTLFQDGAHSGFHEGVGDAIALSITPGHLKKIGLLESASEDQKALLNSQMQEGLDKIAFLPFGLIIDKWRWDVFSGKTKPENYNAAWWKLREEYQGIRAPIDRSEDDFDPGAKYHVPANTPYSRYFLARILQFQFHKAMCDAAGHEGPLHTCSIYGNKKAGEKLKAMLAMGASKPWPEALKAIAGTKKMDGQAMLDYFAPLQSYLEEQNKGRTCGW